MNTVLRDIYFVSVGLRVVEIAHIDYGAYQLRRYFFLLRKNFSISRIVQSHLCDWTKFDENFPFSWAAEKYLLIIQVVDHSSSPIKLRSRIVGHLWCQTIFFTLYRNLFQSRWKCKRCRRLQQFSNFFRFGIHCKTGACKITCEGRR